MLSQQLGTVLVHSTFSEMSRITAAISLLMNVEALLNLVTTFHANKPASSGFRQTNDGIDNIKSRNNILRVSDRMYSYTQSDRGTVGGPNSHDYNYNALYTSGTIFARWSGDRYDNLAEWVAGKGLDANSLEIDALNEWVDPNNNNYELKPESVLIDYGEILPNFNDLTSAWPYSGIGPDLGAFESTFEDPNAPPQIFNPSPSGKQPTTSWYNRNNYEHYNGQRFKL